MHRSIALAALTLALSLAVPSYALATPPALATPRALAADAKAAEVKSRYEALFEANDHEGCVKLWRETPGKALTTIDADLEGSLKLIESTPAGDAAATKKMQMRAVFGARAAAQALGHPLVLDYATSFVGWKPQEQRQFRDGQSVYKKAVKALEQREFALAVRAGRECVERATPLGDWWGVAMGYEIQGRAYQSAGSLDDALGAYAMARLLQHDLALREDEHSTLLSMIDMLNSLGRPLRGKVAVEEALALSRELGDRDAERDLLRRKAEFEDKLGDTAAAEATRRALEAQK